MKLTKAYLKQLIKEEIAASVVSGAAASEKDATDFLRKDALTLKQFIKENPQAKEYITSGVMERFGTAPINPALIRKMGQVDIDEVTIFYKSEKDQQVSRGFDKMVTERPWSETFRTKKGTSWTAIGQMLNTSIIASSQSDLQTSRRGLVLAVSFIISTDYLVPRHLYNTYAKAYGAKQSRSGLANALKLYQYTADYIKELTGREIPGSTASPVKSPDDLPNKPIYMYSYLLISVEASRRTGNQ